MKEIYIKLAFKGRWELYLLKIKIGHPFKSKLMIAITELPQLMWPTKSKVLFG